MCLIFPCITYADSYKSLSKIAPYESVEKWGVEIHKSSYEITSNNLKQSEKNNLALNSRQKAHILTYILLSLKWSQF
jgi:hypothetical protein